MGGTILPPTQREIESENRHLKNKLDEVYSSVSKIANGSVRPDKTTLGRLKDIMEFIKPPKRTTNDRMMTKQEVDDWLNYRHPYKK